MKVLKLLKGFQICCNKVPVKRGKYFFLVVLFVVSSAFSKGYSQTELKLNFKDVEIEKIISFIEKRTDYRFLYQPSDFNLKKKISINYKGKVTDVVAIIFKNTAVYPVVVNKQIILKPNIKLQQRVISGKVVDVDGMPLPDVNILVNRFERGTITDASGHYKITAKTSDKILFSFIGFKDQEIVVENNDVINITLQIDNTLLDEVVLVGYGKKERGKIATSIATIKGKEIQNNIQSGASFDRSLSGAVKGLKITQGAGRPGSGVDINIRGYTSPFTNSANNPLFVIDGVPIQAKKELSTGFNTNPLASINPNDIESLNILKDAAATSIYGSRGANGVIIIKTKKGLKNQPFTVSMSVKSTFSRPINTLKYLNTEQYKKYVGTLVENAVQKGNSLTPFTNDWFILFGQLSALGSFGVQVNPANFQFSYNPSVAEFGKANTNWSDVVYRNNAYTQEYNTAISGGTEKSIYGLSLRYLNQEGLLKADEYTQYNARVNFSITPSKKWNLGTNISLGATKNNTGYVSINRNLNALLAAKPDLEVYDEKGQPTIYSPFHPQYLSNPLGMTTKHYGKVNGKSATGNIFAEYELLKGLKLRGALNIAHFESDVNNYISGKYNSIGFILGDEAGTSSLLLSEFENTNIVSDFTVKYNKFFTDKHSFNLLAGVTKTREYIKNKTENYEGFTNDNLRFPQYAQSKGLDPQRLTSSNNGLNSYITRASYGYNNKYNLTATIRLDQTTKFAPSKRNAWFPSVAVSWNIHNENFIANKNKINNLKLRLSYGNTGSTNVPSFTFIQKFTAGKLYNGKTAVGPSTTLANPFANWEKTTEINFGLDFGILQNRISGGIDIYNRRTKGSLIASPYPLETGASLFTSNFATIDNKGFEVDANFIIINNEHFNWSFGVNATKNINKLISFDSTAVDENFEDNYQIGKEINLIKGYVVEGIYQSPEEVEKLNTIAQENNHNYYDRKGTTAGDYKFKDIDGNNTINSKDRQILGSTQPDLFGGFKTQLGYKNFSLNASFSYSFGAESQRQLINELRLPSVFSNIEQAYAPKNRWSVTNKTATLPRIALDAQYNGRTSSATVYDASFVRFKNIKFAYKLPYSIIENLKLSDVSFYISGNNLYTWTNFPGLDPESTTGGAFVSSTINSDPYPISKSFTLGIDVKF